MDEIERLGEKIEWLEKTIAQNKALMARAANALIDKNWPTQDYGANAKLIVELRKAAE